MLGSACTVKPVLDEANRLKYFSIVKVGYMHIQLHSLSGNTLNICSK